MGYDNRAFAYNIHPTNAHNIQEQPMFYHNSRRLVSLLAAVTAASALQTAPALAQGVTALEEVIVTAQRRETLLQDTPIAVTAFSEEKIKDLGIFDITDISALAPNTNIRKQPSSNSNMSIFIRGVGSGETSLMEDPKVSFYMDGVYMSKTVGAVFDIVDLEGIEVLRGPQGTLFGRNSTGGAINVRTAKPSGELNARVELSTGNDGYRRALATVDLPKVADIMAVKVSGMHMEYDGWASNDYAGNNTDPRYSVINNSESKLASEENDSYRIAVRLDPTDNLTIDYTYDKTENEGVPAPFQITKVKDSLNNGFSNTPVPFVTLGGGANGLFGQMEATIGDPDERRESYTLDFVSTEILEVEGHTLQVEWAQEDFTLKYIYADRETNSTYDGTDLDGGAYMARDRVFSPRNQKRAISGNAPTPGFHARIVEGEEDPIEMTTHELQLFGNLFDDKLAYTFGYYRYEEDTYQNNPQTFSLPITNLIAGAGRSAIRRTDLLTGGEGDTAAAQMLAMGLVLNGHPDPALQDVGYAGEQFCDSMIMTNPQTNQPFAACQGIQRLPTPSVSPRDAFGNIPALDAVHTDPNGNGYTDFIYGQESKSWAVYTQFTYTLNEQVDITAGMRYTEDEKDGHLYNENLLTAPDRPMAWDQPMPVHTSDNPLTNKDEWDNLSYLLNVNWAVNDDMNVYGTWSTGYNAGGFNARAASLSGWNEQVDEEEISAFELGLKAEWLDGRLRTNVAAFYNDYTDIQIAQFEAGSGGASSRLVNAGEATYSGFELDLVAVPMQGLVVDATYGYLDAEFEEYLVLNTDTNMQVDISGNTTVPRTPENTFSLGVQYDIPPLFDWGTLSVRVDANYLDDMVFHPFNNEYDSAEARWLMNARVNLTGIDVGNGSLRLSAWGKNLLDEEYREWGIDFAGLGFAGNVYGQPRTYGLDLSYEF